VSNLAEFDRHRRQWVLAAAAGDAVKQLELPARAGSIVVKAVDKAVMARWPIALRNAAATSGSVDERVAQIEKSFRRELTVTGAAAGATAAVPVVGTAAALSVAAGELSWMTVRSADMILAIAAAHGLDDATIEERRTWVLAVLLFGDAAAKGATRLAGELGKGLGSRATNRVSAAQLAKLNRAMGRTIVTKYGTKRGAIVLCRLLPFGIGAAIGGSANYILTKAIAGHANSFFLDLPEGLRSGPGS